MCCVFGTSISSNWPGYRLASLINVAVNILVDNLVRNCQASNGTSSCSRPNITRLNFDHFVSIPNGTIYNHTLSCEIRSDTPLKEEPIWGRDYPPSLPAGHSVDNSSCSFSTDRTCILSNLTLTHVARDHYEGNYTLTAENDCGNATVHVMINIISKFHSHFCAF